MHHLTTIGPLDFLFRTTLLLLILTCFAGWMMFYPSEADGTFLLVFAVLGAISLAELYLRRSYRVSHDDSAIYWRKVGLRGRFSQTVVMPFDRIEETFAVQSTFGLRPFEAAILRADGHDIPDIVLSRLYLSEWTLQYILRVISERSQAELDTVIQAVVQAE
jgi:hypothetical protein